MEGNEMFEGGDAVAQGVADLDESQCGYGDTERSLGGRKRKRWFIEVWRGVRRVDSGCRGYQLNR